LAVIFIYAASAVAYYLVLSSSWWLQLW
jgi:hypothetical protein